MKPTRIVISCILLLISIVSLARQKGPKTKFGDVKDEDFAPTVYSIDSNAEAVVLYDMGNSVFEGGVKGDFVLVYNHQKRIRIMNKNGFDAATIEIPLDKDGTDEEKLDKLEAVTYNLENGQVVATKLDKASVFKDKYNENRTIRKFTFPNIKEGSIVEYKYTVSSPFYFNLQPWDFQAGMPRLWSEYTVTIPNDILDFVMIRKGYQQFVVDTSTSSYENYHLVQRGTSVSDRSESFTIHSKTITARWAMENVPALKPESFITTLDNYRARLEFQLRRIKYSESHIEEIMGDWYQLTDRMMKREDFGQAINAGNGWMNDDLKKITTGATDDYTKAKKVYEYIRDNFTCTQHYGRYISTTLKKVFDAKSGTVSDINLLLTAALKHLNFEAAPAILSTRDNGLANEMYPLIGEYNYVICRVKIGDEYYMLDASDKLGFGKLPEEVYNSSARVISDIPALITLSPDSIKETKMTSFFAVNEDDKISATLTTQYGDFRSKDMRDKLSKMQPSDYLKEIKLAYSYDPELSNIQIDSLNQPENPLAVKYDLKFGFNDDDIVYFNPVIADMVKENPFKSAERYYPVEMNACKDETYLLNMEIPKGYKVEELPKSARVMLNENEGMFEYIVQASADHIQLRCRTLIKKATFEPEDYQTLRDFFAFIVQKEAEQIVFKKIK
ncbi:MAG: DUF3857 domain-containing protein [Panacibacter sp.]